MGIKFKKCIINKYSKAYLREMIYIVFYKYNLYNCVKINDLLLKGIKIKNEL